MENHDSKFTQILHHRGLTAPRRHRKGATPLGFAIWFILALVVTVGLLTAFQASRDGLRAVALRTQLTQAQAIVERGHAHSGIFAAGSLLVFLADAGFTDQQLQRVSAGNYNFTSPYDTAITIVGDGARDFTIAVAGLPQKGCAAALSAFQESGAGLDSASVGSTALTLPMTSGAIQAACDNTANTVSLTF
jgi:hypothetical protein